MARPIYGPESGRPRSATEDAAWLEEVQRVKEGRGGARAVSNIAHPLGSTRIGRGLPLPPKGRWHYPEAPHLADGQDWTDHPIDFAAGHNARALAEEATLAKMRADAADARAHAEAKRANDEQDKAARMRAKLVAAGIDPDTE